MGSEKDGPLRKTAGCELPGFVSLEGNCGDRNWAKNMTHHRHPGSHRSCCKPGCLDDVKPANTSESRQYIQVTWLGPRGGKSGSAVEISDSKAVSETLNANRFSLSWVITYKSKKPRVHQINKLLHLFFFSVFLFPTTCTQTPQEGQLHMSHALPVCFCLAQWGSEKDWGFWGKTFSHFSRNEYLMLPITCDHMLST